MTAWVGEPGTLAVGSPAGALAGRTLAVKDVIDVAGTVTGAGNPTFAASRRPAAVHAPAVAALVGAGATVVGKTITDELAYSLAGTNVHHGTPPNPAAPGRVPGGSSAGSASAVAAGACDLALGTDTGGSIRVPASYCGLVGWRPTHGAVPIGGVVPLAPSFDTVGLLARDAALLRTAAIVLLGPAPSKRLVAGTVLAEELLALVVPPVGAAIRMAVPGATVALGLDLAAAAEAFRVLQGWEAWGAHGPWITAAQPAMGPGIAARFAAAAAVTDDDVASAEVVRAEVRRVVADATAGGRVVVAPAASGAAPRLDEPAGQRADLRTRTLQLTCLAGLAGAPVVVLPLAADDGLPLGVACLGAPASDRALLRWAAELAP